MQSTPKGVHLVCTQFFAIIDPPPPGTQYDVIVTINWPLIHTHWANPPPPLAYILNGLPLMNIAKL